MSAASPQTPVRLCSNGGEALPTLGCDTALTFNLVPSALEDIPGLGFDSTPSTCNDYPATPTDLLVSQKNPKRHDVEDSPTPPKRERLQSTRGSSSMTNNGLPTICDVVSELEAGDKKGQIKRYETTKARFDTEINLAFSRKSSSTANVSSRTRSQFVIENDSVRGARHAGSPSERNTPSYTKSVSTASSQSFSMKTKIEATTPVSSNSRKKFQTAKSQLLHSILPYDALERFEADQGHCIAECTSKSREGKRCGRPMRCVRSREIDIRSRIAQVKSSGKLEDIICLIPEMIEKFMVNEHRAEARHKLCVLLRYICRHSIADNGINKEEPAPWPTLADLDAIPFWIMSLTTSSSAKNGSNPVFKTSLLMLQDAKCWDSDLKLVFTHALAIAESKQHVVKRGSSKQTSVHNDVLFDRRSSSATIDQDFAPYYSDSTIFTPDRIRASLHALLLKPLTWSQWKSGYIYMYWTVGNFGYIKIGLTRRTVGVRLREWERKCKHAIEALDLSNTNAPEMPDLGLASGYVPYVSRVEELVHCELSRYRYQELNCAGCGGNHVEWFGVDKRLAEQTVAKWSWWMQKHLPYEQPGMLFDPSIKEEEIATVCQPIQLRVDPSLGRSNDRRKSAFNSRANTVSGEGRRRSQRFGTASVALDFSLEGAPSTHPQAGENRKMPEPSSLTASVAQTEAHDETDSEDETDGGAKLEDEKSVDIKIKQEVKMEIKDEEQLEAEASVKCETTISMPIKAEQLTIQTQVEVITVTATDALEKKDEIVVKVEEVEGRLSGDEISTGTMTPKQEAENLYESDDEREDVSEDEEEDEEEEEGAR